MNIVQALLNMARTRPDTAALIGSDRTLSYRDLAREILQTCGHLAALGIAPGDRVGICLKDTPDHVVALLAAARIGALPVPVDWRARQAEKERAAGAFGLKRIVVEPDEQHLTGPSATTLDDAWRRAIARASPPADLPDDWNAPFVVTPTSGTTGAPKFGLLTHLQYFLCVAAIYESVPFPRHARCLMTLPLHFSNGRKKCVAHLLRGDTVVLHPPLFSAREYVDLVNRHAINVGHVLPAVLRQLLQIAPDEGPLLPTMEVLSSAGAPLFAEEKLAVARRITPKLCEEYGTAVTGLISTLLPEDLAERADSVGRPHSLIELQIVDEHDAPLPEGAIGRLRCRGPGLGSGVFAGAGAESATEGFRDGWYYTGELASLDERGYLFLKGRTAEVIMRGSAKIFPAEVEAVLQQHPRVAEAAVVGYSLAAGGEEVAAFVVAKEPVTAGELVAHCRAHLTAYKTPREFLFVEDLPKSNIGKVNKRALAEQLAARPQGRK